MTVNKIETVIELIEEMQATGEAIGTVWEYEHKLSKKTLFGLFLASQYCDIYESFFVTNPKLIWTSCNKFMGDYEYLN